MHAHLLCQLYIVLPFQGTLRVLLVLLHDFPEFLCEYHYGFCDVIPPNCIQMRNLILSAFPRNMRLPDPFTPNLKVDMLPEITVSPKIHTTVANLIQPPDFKKNLDSYLKNRTPVTFLSDMRTYLQVCYDLLRNLVWNCVETLKNENYRCFFRQFCHIYACFISNFFLVAGL